MGFKERKKKIFLFCQNVDPIRLVRKKNPHKLKKKNKNCKNEKKKLLQIFLFFLFSFISCELKQSSVRGWGKGDT